MTEYSMVNATAQQLLVERRLVVGLIIVVRWDHSYSSCAIIYSCENINSCGIIYGCGTIHNGLFLVVGFFMAVGIFTAVVLSIAADIFMVK